MSDFGGNGDSTVRDTMQGVSVIWLIAGVVLAAAELFTLDLVLIMLGAGAFGAALAAALDAPLPVQLGVFAVVSALGLLGVRPAIRKRLHRNAEPAAMGVAAIEGGSAMVVEEVAEGRGMVKIGGEHWQARPADASQVIAVGAQVRVVEIRGATALVWKE
jgi:membrane protein implicated in regulation of membrane protease activity